MMLINPNIKSHILVTKVIYLSQSFNQDYSSEIDTQNLTIANRDIEETTLALFNEVVNINLLENIASLCFLAPPMKKHTKPKERSDARNNHNVVA